VALQRLQAGLGQAFVDRRVAAAAMQDQVDAAHRQAVPARLVGGVAGRAGAVIGRVDVEAAVRLAERSHVGRHPLRPEQLVEPDQVFVAFPLGDRPRGDQLMAVAGVGGGDVQHGARPRRLPAFDRVGEVRSPGAEALDQRRVLVQGGAEMAEVGRVAGVADAEEDPLARRQQRPGVGLRHAAEQQGAAHEGGQCKSSSQHAHVRG